MLDFEESFWGEEGTGFDVLAAKFWRSNGALKDLIAYFKESAALEERHAKDFLKLNLTYPLKADDGTVQLAQSVCMRASEVFARVHSELSARILGEVVQPLETLRGNLKSEFRQTEETYQKAVKNLSKEGEKVEKARLNYVSKSKERDKADPAGDPKKSKEKFLKMEKEAVVAVSEYRRAIAEWERCRDRWFDDMKTAAKVVQKIEEQRILFIRSVMLSILNWQSRDAIEQKKKMYDTYREALEQISAQKDIQSFIERYQTGSAEHLPPSPVFRHYLTNERVLSNDSLFSSSVSSLTKSASQISVNSDPDQKESEEDGPAAQPSAPKISPSNPSPLMLTREFSRSDESLSAPEEVKRKTSASSDDKKPSFSETREEPPQGDKAEKSLKLEKKKPEKEKERTKLDKRKSISLKLKGLGDFAHRGKEKTEKTEKSPIVEAPAESSDTSPRKARVEKPKSLPFLAIETIDSESRGRSGSFTMVNPLAAEVIIPSPIATEVTDRIEIFRTLIQRNSAGQLAVQQGHNKEGSTVRQSVWVEEWIRYKESLEEDWKETWGTVEGGCIWFFSKPEDNFEPPGMNQPQGKISLRGCHIKRGMKSVRQLKRSAAVQEEDSWDEESDEEEEEVEQMKLKGGDDEDDNNYSSVGLTLEHTNRTKKLYILTGSPESQDKWHKALESFSKFS